MSDLLKQIESEHNIKFQQNQVDEQDEEYEQSHDENAEMANDLDDFEKKIQMQKQQDKNDSDSSDNSDSDSNNFQNNKKQKKVLFGGSSDMVPHRKPPSINKIQANIMTQQKAQNIQNEDFQLQQVLNSGSDSLKDKKIRELVQRNRNLQVQYEREKALKQKMENQLNQVLKDNEETLRYREQQMGINSQSQSFNQTNKSNGLGQIKKPPRSGNANRSYSNNFSDTQSVMSEVADGDWQKKYQQVDKKLQEYRVNNQKLKNELNKALRVISREIGENFNIDKVLLEENSWKGRAQQIEKLKAKVRDLNQKLGTTSQMSGMTGMTGMSEFGFGGLQGKQDKTAADRRKEIQELKDKNSQLQDEYDLLQNKFKASQSRKNNLEQELKDTKAEYDKNKKLLLSKSNADDQFIQALKSEYEKLKAKKTETRVIYQNRCQFDHNDQIIQQKEKNDNINKIHILEEDLKTKESMIQELINEKLKNDEYLMKNGNNNNNDSNNSQIQLQYQQKTQANNNNTVEQNEKKIQLLQSEIKVLKKERNDFFANQIEDKEARLIIKDLSMQNAKLRAKIDDLTQKQ